MPLTINTNMAASQAAYYLSRNNDNLQASLNRLSSGKRITQPSDDAGGLAVSMKLNGSIDRIKASNNVSNAISFLQVQDGILESAGNIVSRMGELKGLYSDVLKSSSDKATYDAEFRDLQGQLFQLAQTKFNGVSLFSMDGNGDGAQGTNGANNTGKDDATAVFTPNSTNGLHGRTLEVYVTEDGSSGSKVSINQSLLLSAISFNDADGTNNVAHNSQGDIAFTLANSGAIASTKTLDDADFTTALFTKALENIATLRAMNGGQVSRLNYAQQNLQSQATNMQAAVGRIMDVDVAEETANLAKQQILVQASASMVAQANTANNVALMLLQ